VVSVTDPYSRILGFLDRSRYLFFQVAPQLYSKRLSERRNAAVIVVKMTSQIECLNVFSGFRNLGLWRQCTGDLLKCFCWNH
jgi:hypothetical protein